MASAQSLMGLMSQLQSMENNFTYILMEAALKLASLAGDEPEFFVTFAFLLVNEGTRST